jgi:hypothetical protein
MRKIAAIGQKGGNGTITFSILLCALLMIGLRKQITQLTL